MKYFLFGFGTVVFVCLLLAAISFELGLMLTGKGVSKHTLKTLQEITSPDGSRVATAYVDMGGGAAGWCEAEVNVRQTGTELPSNEQIFSADCMTKVELSWDSNNSLTVAFTPDDIDFGISQTATTKDGLVKIKYVEGKPVSKNQPNANQTPQK